MSQDFIEITNMINHLTQRDFIRLKIYINEKFEKMKKENPKKINNIVYAVKNPEKVKDSVNKYRRKIKSSSNDYAKNHDNQNENYLDSNDIEISKLSISN